MYAEIPTMPSLTLTTLGLLVIPALLMGKPQEALRDAEQRSFFQTWQLCKLLPERAQPAGVAT